MKEKTELIWSVLVQMRNHDPDFEYLVQFELRRVESGFFRLFPFRPEQRLVQVVPNLPPGRL